MYNSIFWILLVVAAASATDNPFHERTIAGKIWAQPEIFSTLNKALESTGLDVFLDCPEGCDLFTVFTPSDEAFEDFEHMHWFDNDQYTGHLKELVLYHIIHGRIYANDLTDGEYYPTLLQEHSLLASVDNGASADDSVKLNYDVIVFGFDNWARNGLIQGVATVLLPPCAQETVLEVVKSRARGFYDILKESGLSKLLRDDSSPMTVLAPLDSALEDTMYPSDIDALREFIEYHFILDFVVTADQFESDEAYANALGSNVALSPNDIVTPDILGSNGVVHFIDHILAPPLITMVPTDAPVETDVPTDAPVVIPMDSSTPAPTDAADAPVVAPAVAPTDEHNDAPVVPPTDEPIDAPVIPRTDAPSDAAPTEPQSLWDLLFQFPELAEFRKALSAANLDETLQAPGTMTLFAPVNEVMESFAVRPGNQQDRRALLYHIVKGQNHRRDFSDKIFQTSSRDNVLVDVGVNSEVILNGLVEVSAFHQDASNGVLHMISERLHRPTDLITTAVARGMTSFVNALKVSKLAVSSFQEEGPYTIFAWSNEAWDRFEDAEKILKDPARLRKLILYHVVPEFLLFDDLKEGSYTTMLEQDLQVHHDHDEPGSSSHVHINDAYVSSLDYLASNGCLHRISQVLVPPK